MFNKAWFFKDAKKDEILAHKDLIVKLDRANEIYNNFFSPYSDVKNRASFSSIIYRIYLDQDNHFVSLAAGSDGRVSYARKFEDRYNPLKKVRTSFARYLRRGMKISSSEIPDIDLEVFQEAFKLAIQSKECLFKQIKVLRGNDIVDYYRDTLIKSCMTGISKTKKNELYAINKDKVGLVVINNLARGLLWNCDDGTIYLDKVYGSVLGCSILYEWCRKNGYEYRFNLINYNYNRYLNLEVTLKMTSKTGTPCLDTFFYGKLVFDEEKEIIEVKVSAREYNHRDVCFSDTGLVYI